MFFKYTLRNYLRLSMLCFDIVMMTYDRQVLVIPFILLASESSQSAPHCFSKWLLNLVLIHLSVGMVSQRADAGWLAVLWRKLLHGDRRLKAHSAWRAVQHSCVGCDSWPRSLCHPRCHGYNSRHSGTAAGHGCLRSDVPLGGTSVCVMVLFGSSYLRLMCLWWHSLCLLPS